jgi:hypothetical protein
MVSSMHKEWRGLNVDLSNLTNEVIQFFESRKFNNVTALRTEKGYEVIAGDSKHYKMESDVSVTIEGKADNFSINLTSCSGNKKTAPSSNSMGLPLMLASMFGAGYFLLKGFRSEEAMLKLERDFTQRIGSMVERSGERQSQVRETGM